MTPVRKAHPPDRTAVANVLDGAALAVDHDDLADRLLAGDVYLYEAEGPVLGALLLEPPVEGDTCTDGPTGTGRTTGTDRTTGSGGNSGGGDARRITAIAVRRRRRGQGIGSALVAAAAAEAGALVAEFDADLRPFYDALGFAIEPLGGARYRGHLPAQDGTQE